MKKLLLLLIMVLAISCGSRDDEPIVTPSDGYVLAKDPLDANLANTNWVTHHGENPATSIFFNNSTKSIRLTLKGVEYSSTPIYYKKDTNMAGEFYIKVGSGYGRIYVQDSEYNPGATMYKKMTFSGFTSETTVLYMLKQ